MKGLGLDLIDVCQINDLAKLDDYWWNGKFIGSGSGTSLYTPNHKNAISSKLCFI